MFGDTRADSWQRRRRQTSQVPGEPFVTVRLGLGPRWDRHARPLRRAGAAPGGTTARAPDEKKLSRLDVQAFRLTVYASQGGSPHRHARLASGCWPALPDGIRTRRVPTEGFRVVVTTSHSPSPGFAWRKDPFVLLLCPPCPEVRPLFRAFPKRRTQFKGRPLISRIGFSVPRPMVYCPRTLNCWPGFRVAINGF